MQAIVIRPVRRLPVLLPTILLAATLPAAAGQQADPQAPRPSGGSGLGINLTATLDGPPPPEPPAVVARDEQGRATVRAVRVAEPIRLDGRLDEAVYTDVLPITGFIQQVPDEGAPATEQTEAWLLFDDEHIYVGVRCYDSAPPGEWVANDMRRDTPQLRQNDTFAVIFDTFYDRRNGVAFYTNPLGARADFAITNEGNPNSDWNPVWDVRTGRFEGGWTAEMEIPFKSLRYRPGAAQVWGFQMRRVVRRKNEGSYITPLPISAVARSGAIGGIFRVSDAATLVGLEAPQGSRNMEIKPYAIGGAVTDREAAPGENDLWGGNAGLDVKVGVTQNLTADFTYRTDFAQVEVDEQQVNLTRFNLFFPEKREFFLEGRGIFEFATGGVTGGPGGFRDPNAPLLFYSRRIGLQENHVVPIVGGGRLTGKVGAFDVGALSIQTDDHDTSGALGTNFSVLRIKRDVLRKSSIGALVTNRSVSTLGDGAGQTYGVDGTFSFYENVHFLAYAARTNAPGRSDRNNSYQGKFDYTGDLYGIRVNHLLVEEGLQPGSGVRAPRQLPPVAVRGALQPAAEHRPRAAAPHGLQLRVHADGRHVAARDAHAAARRRGRVRERRPAHLHGARQLRAAVRAVLAGRRHGHTGRRVRLHRLLGAVPPRAAAPRQRDGVAAEAAATSTGTSRRSRSSPATWK